MGTDITVITRSTGTNQGGGVRLFVAPRDQVATMPAANYGEVNTNIIMQVGKSFTEIPFIPGTARPTEPMIGEVEGHSWEPKLAFMVAKRRKELRLIMSEMIGQPLIAVFKDANGTKWLYGANEDFPMRLTLANADGGAAPADRNHVAFELTGFDTEMALVYSGNTP